MPGGVRVEVAFDRFPELIAKSAPAVGAAVKETLVAIERDVKQNAPIRTGNLRRSYHWEMDTPLSGEVGNDLNVAPYAIFVELGTRKMAAEPHLRPAAERQKALLPARVAAHLKAML